MIFQGDSQTGAFNMQYGKKQRGFNMNTKRYAGQRAKIAKKIKLERRYIDFIKKGTAGGDNLKTVKENLRRSYHNIMIYKLMAKVFTRQADILDIKDIKKIGQRLTGLKIMTNNGKGSAFIFNRIGGAVCINLDRLEALYIIKQEDFINRGFNTENKSILYLQILLHEVCHYKQYKKQGYDKHKSLLNNTKQEKTADRYAQIYYKRFI